MHMADGAKQRNGIRVTRNGNVLYDGQFPPDAKVKTSKADDGTTVYDIQTDADDMPGSANSELEARIPAQHAHGPFDIVGPKPEGLNPEKAAKAKSTSVAVEAEVQSESAEGFQAPAEAQKDLLKAEGRDPDASDAKNKAAKKRNAAAARKSNTTRGRTSTAK